MASTGLSGVKELGEVRCVGETGGFGSIVWCKDQMGAETPGVFSEMLMKDMSRR